MPDAAAANENSKAPNKLFVSVIATAGIRSLRQRSTIPGILSAPSRSE